LEKKRGAGLSSNEEAPVPLFSALFPPYLNDRLVWRIRSFMMLICPSKSVFGTVTV
jgi:hypothetical protein